MVRLNFDLQVLKEPEYAPVGLKPIVFKFSTTSTILRPNN